MALDRSDGVAVADPRAARPRRRAELRPRTLIRRFEPAAAETREGGAPRVSGVVALRTRLRTDAADELRAPGEDVRGVNYDHSRTDAEAHLVASAAAARRGGLREAVEARPRLSDSVGTPTQRVPRNT